MKKLLRLHAPLFAAMFAALFAVCGCQVTTLAPPAANGTTTAVPAPPPTSTAPLTTQRSTLAPVVVATPAPLIPTNTSAAEAQRIEFPIIIGGGVVFFCLLIGACYVVLMWQQKALRLYKATFEEAIKERGKARREIQEVILRGENKVFDYAAKGNDDANGEEDDDMSPAAMRARILGQHYTAARYVERVVAHPMKQESEHPSKYVGKGPVYMRPRPLNDTAFDDVDMIQDSRAAPPAAPPSPAASITTPPLFHGMSVRRTPQLSHSHTSAAPPGTLDATQERILSQARIVHAAIHELHTHTSLKNHRHESGLL